MNFLAKPICTPSRLDEVIKNIGVSIPLFCLPGCQLHSKAGFLCSRKMLPVANRASLGQLGCLLTVDQ